jgi:hypothetical protein
LGLMPQIRTLRPHDTHRVQIGELPNVRWLRAVCGSNFVAKCKEFRSPEGAGVKGQANQTVSVTLR